MSDKVLNQDLNDRVPDRNVMMMAQLLFREKPKQADADALKAALEALIGEVNNITDKPEMPMFSTSKFKAVFSDKPEGVPVLANYIGPHEFSAEKLDEMTRSQFWDFRDGSIDDFKYCVDAFAMLGAGLPYKEQAELFLAQVDAALKCYPECEAIFVIHSGKLTTPADFEHCKQFALPERFIRLAVNARFFNIQDTDDMIVDTLGFFAFGGADVQLHFHGLDPNHAVEYVYNIASYQFANDFPVKTGDTIDGIENGIIVQHIQWETRYEDSLIQPVRPVLDINCGEFASGRRGASSSL